MWSASRKSWEGLGVAIVNEVVYSLVVVSVVGALILGLLESRLMMKRLGSDKIRLDLISAALPQFNGIKSGKAFLRCLF
jgi:hypothetical protein